MKKKTNRIIYILTVIAVLCVGLAFSASAAGETYTENGYTYTVNNGTATITAVDDTVTGDVVIPETLGGYTVTKIGYGSFEKNSTITSVFIPESIITVGEYAFYDCKNLLEVNMADGVQELQYSSFGGCVNLQSIKLSNCLETIRENAFIGSKRFTEIVLPESLITVERLAFSGCENLKEIIIPDSVKEIGSFAFYACFSLKNAVIGSGVEKIGTAPFEFCDRLLQILVSEENMQYCSDEYGVLFNKEKTELIQYPAGNSRSTYQIPEGVVKINQKAFWLSQKLKNIVFPDTIETIEKQAFKFCIVKEFNLTKNISSIAYDAFDSCYQLRYNVDSDNLYYSNDENGVLFDKRKTVLIKYPNLSTLSEYTIPDTVNTICESAFNAANNLYEVSIPGSVKRIPKYTFSNSKIKNVKIGYGVETIESTAFYNTKIEELILPDSITTLEDYALSGCPYLEHIEFSNNLKVLGKKALSDCVLLKDFSLPDGLEEIGESAFENCEKIENIKIPNSVKSIGKNAFSNCPLITSISIPSVMKNLTQYSLANMPGLNTVYVYSMSAHLYNAFEKGRDVSDLTVYGYSGSVVQAISDYQGYSFVPLFDGIDWNFSEGKLTLSQKKEVSLHFDEYYFEYPWSRYADVTSVICLNNVTRVENGMFENFSNSDIVITNGEPVHFCNDAFKNCDSLKNVVLFSNGEFEDNVFANRKADITYYIQSGKTTNIPSISFSYDEENKTLIFDGDVSVSFYEFFNLLDAMFYGYGNKQIDKLSFNSFIAEDFQFIYRKNALKTVQKNMIEDAELIAEVGSNTFDMKQISFNELREGIGNNEITDFRLVATDKEKTDIDNDEQNIFIRLLKALLALLTKIFNQIK